ncbi:MAG TPA: Txe/YoeB family addiction module toxin [Alphaproteobacteria bacterium]|nr:Txe/YoeB family addiction module toxin [Alphaproteobacteria bacterium]
MVHIPQSYKIEFESAKAEGDFKSLLSGDYESTAKKLLDDIFDKPWGTEGTGKPELLRGNLKGYISRRITDEDRLVYRYEDGKIYIRSCKGHYGK